jgi:hypothetical protein
LVDDSPSHIQEELWQEHDGVCQLFRQDKERYQGKGGALRQAIDLARTWFEDQRMDLKECVICFTEPEKVDLINHIHDIAKPILLKKNAADVVVPSRNKELFQSTYPIEQYHSESFANLHFNALARQHEGFQKSAMAGGLDWLFGPFAFNAKLANYWLEYEGKSWDAQMVPYVRGVRDHKWKIALVEVNFVHPSEMKKQEEGEPTWTSKRLHQLNILFDLLGNVELGKKTTTSI